MGKSKFTILGELAKEEDNEHNIEALKKRIKALPGPSAVHGEKPTGKAGGTEKVKQGSPNDTKSLGTSTRNISPKLTIGKK